SAGGRNQLAGRDRKPRRARRACEGAERGAGDPRATEPGSGAEPRLRMTNKTDREKAQSYIAENRKAAHDYHLLETFEAGVVLLGTEVKAIREGRVNLRDSFARVENGE